ncbi:hypothetical protein AURDEDRAFT_173981 [Auricularia subglabra TFB-10046 SS5]|uniref:F-box domain-containing protein n=1 Tax=Auricularia subglabra (strain TFB-10046 / SS5) TaxID=717982 RepID=J0WTK3_AURST|nr:hypothetical protein AURDEDRAFT_173981 [Auricularia subglabra TFB-10046 SS5]
MPDDILEGIFSYLPRADLAAICPQTRTFHRLSNPLLYRRLDGMFTRRAALRLLVTCATQTRCSFKARILDGDSIGRVLEWSERGLLAAALLNMPNLEVLSLPEFMEKEHLVDTYSHLRILHITGPNIPVAFVARHRFVRQMRFHSLCGFQIPANMRRLGPGVPLQYVHCPASVASHLLPSAGYSEPLQRRSFNGLYSVLDVFVPSRSQPEWVCSEQAREFFVALHKTHYAPHTIIIQRHLVRLLAREIERDREKFTVSVECLRIRIDTLTVKKRTQYLEYTKTLLHFFEHLSTLELQDDACTQLSAREWFNERFCESMRGLRPSLQLIVSPARLAFEYQGSQWIPVAPPSILKDPFLSAGLSPLREDMKPVWDTEDDLTDSIYS